MLTLKCCCVIMCDMLSSCPLYFIVSQVIGTIVYSSAQMKQFPFQIIGKVHAWSHRKISEFSSHFSASVFVVYTIICLLQHQLTFLLHYLFSQRILSSLV
jgi:hypothetical protein